MIKTYFRDTHQKTEKDRSATYLVEFGNLAMNVKNTDSHGDYVENRECGLSSEGHCNVLTFRNVVFASKTDVNKQRNESETGRKYSFIHKCITGIFIITSLVLMVALVTILASAIDSSCSGKLTNISFCGFIFHVFFSYHTGLRLLNI